MNHVSGRERFGRDTISDQQRRIRGQTNRSSVDASGRQLNANPPADRRTCVASAFHNLVCGLRADPVEVGEDRVGQNTGVRRDTEFIEPDAPFSNVVR